MKNAKNRPASTRNVTDRSEEHTSELQSPTSTLFPYTTLFRSRSGTSRPVNNRVRKDEAVIDEECQKQACQHKKRHRPGRCDGMIGRHEGVLFEISGKHDKETLAGNHCDT